jgi:murein L,D-transpeptidase YcbB/YkuD
LAIFLPYPPKTDKYLTQGDHDMDFTNAINRYTTLVQSEVPIVYQVMLRKGVQHATVRLVCDKLAILGHLTTTYTGDIVNDAVIEAVTKFQESVNIEVDGIAGPTTFKYLNAEFSRRLKALRYSKPTWDAIPAAAGKKIVVNIPAFEVWMYKDNKHIDTIDCVIGRVGRETAEFSNKVSYADFRPYWNVPTSIFKNDKLPKILAQGPSYVTNNHFEVVDRNGNIIAPHVINWKKYKTSYFPYTFRQKPGPWNALGLVKYMFPNRYSIYMHDTPDKHLFSRKVRAFSSGCVRLSNPPKMGSFLLDLPETTVLNNMNDDTRNHRVINLPNSVPIHITYMTAWIDNNGVEHFGPDIYSKMK